MTGKNSARGFSLVQLVVGLQLGLIASLIAVPKVNGFFAQYQLMSASNQLGFDIARARMQAVGQHRFVRIRMVSTTGYVRETSTDGTTWANDATKSLPTGATTTTTSAEVRFDNRGFATVNNSITINNTLNQVKTLATSVVGRVTIS